MIKQLKAILPIFVSHGAMQETTLCVLSFRALDFVIVDFQPLVTYRVQQNCR